MKNEICQECGQLLFTYIIKEEGKPDKRLCIHCQSALKIKELQDQLREVLLINEELILMNDATNLLSRSYCLSCKKKARKMTDEEKRQFSEIADTLTDENRDFMKDILTKFEKEIIIPKGRAGDDNERHTN